MQSTIPLNFHQTEGRLEGGNCDGRMKQAIKPAEQTS